ncbi:MAG: hypothetical protein QW674_07225 [Candidatus Bathyarchaeia archaeon]
MSQQEKAEKFRQACPESARILEQEKASFEEALLNPCYQKGVVYRAEKLQAIHEARRFGRSEEEILTLLLKGGLTELTAKKMMADSKRVYGEG